MLFFQLNVVNKAIDEYEHDGPPLDLILMSHCFYYFYPDATNILKKLKTWLSKDGIMLIIVDASSFKRGICK